MNINPTIDEDSWEWAYLFVDEEDFRFSDIYASLKVQYFIWVEYYLELALFEVIDNIID